MDINGIRMHTNPLSSQPSHTVYHSCPFCLSDPLPHFLHYTICCAFRSIWPFLLMRKRLQS